VNVSVATINMYIMICCVQYKRNTSNIVRESTRCTKSYRRDGRAAGSSIAISEISSTVDTAPSPNAIKSTSRSSVDIRHSFRFPPKISRQDIGMGNTYFNVLCDKLRAFSLDIIIGTRIHTNRGNKLW